MSKLDEKTVAKHYLEDKFGPELDTEFVYYGDHLKGEPDILYKEYGIELGSILREVSIRSSKREEKFFHDISLLVENSIPDNIRVSLVMRNFNLNESRFILLPENKYPTLVNYFDGFFVNRYSGTLNGPKIILNQSSMNPYTNIPHHEVQKCAKEIISYVAALREEDYKFFDERMGYNFHYALTCTAKVHGYKTNSVLEEFVSKNISDKLVRSKYSGNYSKQILVLHNYEVEGKHALSTNSHFYQHYSLEVIRYLNYLINVNKSLEYYESIIFVDYSQYARNSKPLIYNLKGDNNENS